MTARFDGREYEVPVLCVGALFPPRAQMSGENWMQRNISVRRLRFGRAIPGSHRARPPRSLSVFGIHLLFRRDAHCVQLGFGAVTLQFRPQLACQFIWVLSVRSELPCADRLLSVSGSEFLRRTVP